MLKAVVLRLGLCIALICFISSSAYAQIPDGSLQGYDYLPRKNAIFEDDFTNDSVGKFPARWQLVKKDCPERNGHYTDNRDYFKVKSIGNEKTLDIVGSSSVSWIEPVLPYKYYLPDSFTLEYNISFGNNNAQFQQNFSFENASGNCFEQVLSLSYTTDGRMRIETSGFVQDTNQYAPLKMYDYNLPIVANILTGTDIQHHFAISYKMKHIKCYLDSACILNIPNCGYKPLSTSLYCIEPITIRHVRLAMGEEQSVFDQLSAGKKLTTHAILFSTGSTVIDQGSMVFIQDLANWLKMHPNARLGIYGHTDNDGSPASNVKLSKDRAEAIKKQLIIDGIIGNRLITKGYGDKRPMDTNTTADGKANNRRVEFNKL